MRATPREPTDIGININSLTAGTAARLFLPDEGLAHTLPGMSFLSRGFWERRDGWPVRTS